MTDYDDEGKNPWPDDAPDQQGHHPEDDGYDDLIMDAGINQLNRMFGHHRGTQMSDKEAVEIHEAYAVDGLEPAEVADKYDVGLADVHEAIAFYYRNSDELKELRFDVERTRPTASWNHIRSTANHLYEPEGLACMSRQSYEYFSCRNLHAGMPDGGCASCGSEVHPVDIVEFE